MNNNGAKISPEVSIMEERIPDAALALALAPLLLPPPQTLEELVERQKKHHDKKMEEYKIELGRILAAIPHNNKQIYEKMIEINVKRKQIIQNEIDELNSLSLSFPNATSYLQIKNAEIMKLNIDTIKHKLKLKEIEQVKSCLHCFCCFCCCCIYPCYYNAINNANVN